MRQVVEPLQGGGRTVSMPEATDAIFERGPASVWRRDGDAFGARTVALRAIVLALVAWLPLPVLALVDDGSALGPVFRALVHDWGVHFRLLVALPVLVCADRWCGQRLTAIAYHVDSPDLMDDATRPAFHALTTTARRLAASRLGGLVLVLLGLAVSAGLFAMVPASAVPEWLRASPRGRLSWPGVWHVLVSAPMLTVLVLGWLWRWAIWTWFVARVARLPIRLCAPHPDRAAGARFLGYSIRAFAALGFAAGAIFAGRVANEVWYGHRALEAYPDALAALEIGVIAFACAPLLVFSVRLLHEWQKGVFQYGRVAGELGARFDERWIRGAPRVDAEALHATDFSAAIDGNSYVGAVYDMRLTPIDVRSVVLLVVATAAPLAPVVVVAASFDTLLRDLAGMLF